MNPLLRVFCFGDGIFCQREEMGAKVQFTVFRGKETGSVEAPTLARRFIVCGTEGNLKVVDAMSFPCVWYLKSNMDEVVELIKRLSLETIAGGA